MLLLNEYFVLVCNILRLAHGARIILLRGIKREQSVVILAGAALIQLATFIMSATFELVRSILLRLLIWFIAELVTNVTLEIFFCFLVAVQQVRVRALRLILRPSTVPAAASLLEPLLALYEATHDLVV